MGENSELYLRIRRYTAIVTHAVDTPQCSLVPIIDALYNAPNIPFFSDRNICLSLGTVLMYAHVQITNNINTTTPSKEYTLTILFSQLAFEIYSQL